MRDDAVSAEARLADLVASRLCHDLINPLGAIGNGVELLEMTGRADGPEVALIRDAVRAAEARIRLFRIAFGGAAPESQTSLREARLAVEGYFRDSRITADWRAECDQSRQGTKLALLMLLCAESALPMGGVVTVRPEAQGRWTLEASGARINLDETIWSLLRFGPAAETRRIRPSEAQFPVLVRAASALGQTVNYVATDTTLAMSTI